ncbi:MAG: FAD-dependent oxidoreductase [Pseudomonadota bacterium]
MSRHFGAVVIGAGAAGLTAGIYLARARVETLIVDSGTAGGQMVLTHAVANYPGVTETSGALLARTMRAQARGFGCQIETQSAVRLLDLASAPKRLEVDGEQITADTVILATGGRPRSLGLDSEQRLKGQGISYCATCDGDFFAGMEIVAIGGGNSALEEAVSLAKHARKVTIIHEFDHFQAQPWAVEAARQVPNIAYLMAQEVLDFEGGEALEAVISRDKATGEIIRTPARGAFIFIGYVPRTEELRGLVALNERGEIPTDEAMRTDVPGVFAAGDVRAKRFRQITTAVADGTIAALSAIEHLAGR